MRIKRAASKDSIAAQTEKNPRLHLLDGLRGLALLGMMLYHLCYDVNIVWERNPAWWSAEGVQLWQQLNCMPFLLIAGASAALGTRGRLRRGLVLNLWGLSFTVGTLLFLPEERIMFGILNFMGCALLLCVALERPLRRLPPALGALLAALLFQISRQLPAGYLGLFGQQLALPPELYASSLGAPFGFAPSSFYSADYFPLLPWFFLFLTGYFCARLFFEQATQGLLRVWQIRFPLLDFLGRHSLLVYLLHQPLLFAACWILLGPL